MAAETAACRSCGSPRLDSVLSLGEMPLANALVDPDDDGSERRYPLEAVRCLECTLVQLTKTIPPEAQFRDYSYFSSYSETFLDHAQREALALIERLSLGPESFVVEAGSNDGYLLRTFVEAGIPALGIDPAENVAAVAGSRGIETITAFLDPDLARRIVAERGTADLVAANNVLAHVPDLDGFVSALRILAGDRGLVAIEVPYLCDLVDRLEFDTIYHEHLVYFAVTSLGPILRRHGLAITEIERLPVHGGSLRILSSASAAPGEVVEHFLAAEQAWGVAEPARFSHFADAVHRVRREVRDLVADLVESGADVAGYGAAAKGTVLTNACGLDARLVRFVVDRNPHKQGKLMPGSRIPIHSPERLAAEQPDYCVIFPWNLAAEIVEQQASYRQAGGRFVVPLPEPRVLA